VMERHRKMRVILSHAGGFLPFAAHRIANLSAVMPGAPSETMFLETFRRFYFDTALSASAPAIAGLKAFADPERILFGSDFPYAPGGLHETFTPMLDANPLLSDGERAAINHGNAERLWGRATFP
jgi:6-methylsalicylate decarboxylase